MTTFKIKGKKYHFDGIIAEHIEQLQSKTTDLETAYNEAMQNNCLQARTINDQAAEIEVLKMAYESCFNNGQAKEIEKQDKEIKKLKELIRKTCKYLKKEGDICYHSKAYDDFEQALGEQTPPCKNCQSFETGECTTKIPCDCNYSAFIPKTKSEEEIKEDE